jgi:O-methyltransferase
MQMNKAFRSAISGMFKFAGLKVQKYDKVFPELWSTDGQFQALFNEIKDRTVVSQDRCFMLYQMAQYANNKEGHIAEIGVYKGGTGRLIAKTCPNKQVHLFDTFSGMPKENQVVDWHKQGDFSDTSLDSVKAFLKDCNNVVFHPGLFPGTANEIVNTRFSLVYIDVDIYQSVKDCLEFFYNRVTPAGIIILDDYESRYCLGVKQAVTEFLSDKIERPIITTKHQCIFIKL